MMGSGVNMLNIMWHELQTMRGYRKQRAVHCTHRRTAVYHDDILVGDRTDRTIYKMTPTVQQKEDPFLNLRAQSVSSRRGYPSSCMSNSLTRIGIWHLSTVLASLTSLGGERIGGSDEGTAGTPNQRLARHRRWPSNNIISAAHGQQYCSKGSSSSPSRS